MVVTEPARLGPTRVPALLRYPTGGPTRALVVCIQGGGDAYDKQHTIRALPLDSTPFLRAYVDLPLHGERLVPDFRERYRRDPVHEFYQHAILGMAEELAGVIDDLLQRWPGLTGLGVYGWSIGGMAGLLGALLEKRVQAVAAIAPPTNPEHLDRRYPWDEQAPALKPVFDLVAQAEEFYPTAVLLLHGLEDTWVLPESTELLYRALLPHYRERPERLAWRAYPGMAHDLSDGPPEIVEKVRHSIAAWFTRFLD